VIGWCCKDRIVTDPARWSLEGTEPDPGVSLANERTVLAYSRTALGLVVAGIAVAGSHTAADLPVWFAAIGIPLIVLGASVALAGQRRFIRVQQALRHGEPLPSPTAATLLPFGIAIIGACGLAAAVAELTS
jgi:putative membrane protein